MNKIFIGYRFTGENIDELEYVLGLMRDSLRQAGYEVFCSLWLENYFKANDFSVEERYVFCLNHLRSHKIFLAFVKSPEKSKGLAMEFKEAKAQNKTIFLVIKKGLLPLFPEFHNVHLIVEFEDFQELAAIHKKINSAA